MEGTNVLNDGANSGILANQKQEKSAKLKKDLPQEAILVLKAWLSSHFGHPYPTPQEQATLMHQTGISKKQLKNWFTNARRRIWKPMLKKQMESGIPVMPACTIAGSLAKQAVHFAEADSKKKNPQGAYELDQVLNEPRPPKNVAPTSGAFYEELAATTEPQVQEQIQQPKPAVAETSSDVAQEIIRGNSLYQQPQPETRQEDETNQVRSSFQVPSESTPSWQVPKDSNANPGKASSSSTMSRVPTLNAWPHFSSVNSLNNLGTIPGVKSLASMSGTNLANMGSLSKLSMENLGQFGTFAQANSIGSTGKDDSFSVLQFFLGGQSSNNLSGMTGRDTRHMGDDDFAIGLSLEEEAPPQPYMMDYPLNSTYSRPVLLH